VEASQGTLGDESGAKRIENGCCFWIGTAINRIPGEKPFGFQGNSGDVVLLINQ
jgi:hypothetical protein